MVNEFKKGDYIVTLEVLCEGNCAKENYCFKQRLDDVSIYPEVDLSGSTQNGHRIMRFDKDGWLKNWRYATLQEIAEYNRINKPFDVSKINQELIIEIW